MTSARRPSLDELRPDVEHRYLGTLGGEVGYIGLCACGWNSSEQTDDGRRRSRRSAQGAVAAHIGRSIAWVAP